MANRPMRPTRPKRPRHRRDPNHLDAAVPIYSGRLHLCTGCRITAPWGETWRWYGSHRQQDEGRELVKFCDQHCQEAYEAEHGKLQEDLDPGETTPKVHRAPLIPTAFQVECPSCARRLDVAEWDVDQHGAYAAEDTPLDCCTVLTCEHCGTVVEPAAVAVREAYPHV